MFEPNLKDVATFLERLGATLKDKTRIGIQSTQGS